MQAWQVLWCCLGLTTLVNAKRPHIIYILADDLGWSDVGFRAGDIRTPHIDRLASEGVVLDNFYVQDVCSPSRATFLTGRYPLNHGIVTWIPPAKAYGLPQDESTIAEAMVRSGYAAHAVGKWHAGFYTWNHTPTFRGFQSFLGFYGGGEHYFTHISGKAFDMRFDKQPFCGAGCSEVLWSANNTYSTHLFTRRAIDVVEAHDPDVEPLFLYLAYQAVHSPGEAPQSYIDAYNSTIADTKRRTFAGMLSAMDEGIGNVTAALERKNMLDDAIIVFSTDNGGPEAASDSIGSRNWPLRGGKHSIWEGGVRGTAAIWGAPFNHVKGPYTGLIHMADWFPTLCNIAQCDKHGFVPNKEFDGVDQWDALLNADNPNNHHPRNMLIVGNSTDYCKPVPAPPPHQGCGFGIRYGDYKFIAGWGGYPPGWCNTTMHGAQCEEPKKFTCPNNQCLFHISQDPNERHELSQANLDLVQQLQGVVDHALLNYTEAKPDPKCGMGDQHFEHTKYGDAWQPWC